MNTHATLYSDGGSRGNPGPAGIGFVLRADDRDPIGVGDHIGDATNNQAEYRALLAGMQRAHEEQVTALDCFLDSELVVKQLKGEYRVRDADLRPLFAEVSSLVTHFETVTFTHVRREKNKEADKLVNIALDKAGH